MRDGESLTAIGREISAGCMVLLRDRGEVFLHGNTLGSMGTTSWVERIDPETLVMLRRSPDLEGGPFWPGGAACHADGSIHVVYGRWCHRLDADSLEVQASRELPRDRPYNSFVVLPDGHLATKDLGGGHGRHALADGTTGSEVLVIEPVGLEIVDRVELPEGSVARLSAGVDAEGQSWVYAVGDTTALRLAWDAATGSLDLDEEWREKYVVADGQSFGWDAVVADDVLWFLDDGEGTSEFGPSLRDKGGNTAPLSLVSVPLDTSWAARTFQEVCGEPGGLVANPPAVDTAREIVVGFDSGNGVLAAWRYEEPGDPLEELWRRDQDHAGHLLLFPDTGELVTGDFDHERSVDQCVLLDIETGEERGRIDTGSPVQSVLFPAPGWDRDVYLTTFTTVTRVSIG
jgi:hypothetical protein